MPAIPIRGISLQPFHQGAQFSYRFTFTIDANFPDPNTWTDCRLTLVPPTGTPVTVSKSSMTFTPTGSGPWTLVLVVPLTKGQTLSLPTSGCSVQLDFTTADGEDVILEGSVAILKPKKELP